MAVTIRFSGSRHAGQTLGDLKRGDYFIFGGSTKSVPNLYVVNGKGYTRLKTGKWFAIDPRDGQKGSAGSDRVMVADVGIDYRMAS